MPVHRPRPHRPSRPARPPAPSHRSVIVKVRDDFTIPLPDEFPQWLRRGSPIDAWEALETWLPDLRVTRVFGARGEGTLAGLVERARRVDPTYDPPRLENYVRVRVPDQLEGHLLALAFRAFPVVERAYLEALPAPPPSSRVDPSGDALSARQGYLDAAPDAVDAEYAWNYEGGDGEGQAIVDVEHGWVLEHEDLKDHGLDLFYGENRTSYDHGASVLGVVAAVDNDLGCVGIAPHVASVRCSSPYQADGSYTIPGAIEAAIERMAFGDVLLLELQSDYEPMAGTLYPYAPVELDPAVFDAIRLATACGIVVVEAAGNGAVDLDAVKDASGARRISRDVPASFLDSGAIVVGCASAAEPHTSLGSSCHGSRVDCYAWGEKVTTLSGDGTKTTATVYRDDFEDTSAASAIIAGVALVAQGVAEASLGWRLTPWQMRAVLADPANGTPLATGETERLGVMPNLCKILDDVLGVTPDVYVRDHVGDDGDPHEGAISQSPDVIVTTSPPADPQASWGEGSGAEDVDSLGATVEAGRDHFVFVRVRNRGLTDATDVRATVYWAEPATLLTPDHWTLIGSTTLASVPSMDVLTLSDAIPWAAADLPPAGHYCFVATLEHDLDPEPLPPSITSPTTTISWDEFESYIRRNNNVTWRNFNVEDLDAGAAGAAGDVERAFDFVFAGAWDTKHVFGFEVAGRLPRGSRLVLELPRALARAWRLAPLEAAKPLDGDVDRVSIRLNPWSVNEFAPIPVAAGARHRMRLLVHLPGKTRGPVHRVHARQTYEGREVGRVTWKLVSRRRPPRRDR